MKGFIRKTEAIAGARYAGLPDDHIHFMALPFYETGKVKQKRYSVGERGYTDHHGIAAKGKTAPDIYAAGDFADHAWNA